MSVAAILILVLLFAGLFQRISFLVYLALILPVFGALAIIPPDLLDGSNVTAGALAALFLIAKAFSSKSLLAQGLRAIGDARQLALLWLFLIVAVFGAFILPQIFEGSVRVIPMRGGELDYIKPVTSNITQAGYLTLSTLMAVTICVLAKTARFVDVVLRAIFWGAAALILSGALDLIAPELGLSGLMDDLRAGSYSILSENYILDTRRIIGLMAEASSFGCTAASTCGLILFLRPAFPASLQRWPVPLVALGCGLMAALSTSSTAYVMMGVIVMTYVAYNVEGVRGRKRGTAASILRSVQILCLGLMTYLVVTAIYSDLGPYMSDLLDVLIFQKQDSASFGERSYWTEQALNGFFASGGLGLGIGSVRASNFFVNILASTGVLGAGLFASFLAVVFTRRAPAGDMRAAATIAGAKLALLPMLVGAALSGTTPDFGTGMGLLFGLITGFASSRAAVPRRKLAGAQIRSANL